MHTTMRGFGLALSASVALLLGGCVTPGGYGADGYGQPGGYPSQQYPSPYGSQMQGTVESVDPGYGRILALVEDPRSGRTQRMELRFDQRTRLIYQGREADVAGLERGDVIRFDATPSGSELYVRDIEVLRNVREGGYGGSYGNDGSAYGGGGAYGYANELRGAVAYVDARARVIRLDAGNGGVAQVQYDARTSIEYQGRAYRPEDLERGDQVRVQARQVGNQWLAERIIVERSVR